MRDWKPQIIEWLNEARVAAEAQAKRPNGSRYRLTALTRAIDSIEHNTTEIGDISEISKLPRVGDKTVALLVGKIKRYCAKNPQVPLPASIAASSTELSDATASTGTTARAKRVLSTENDGQMYPFAPPPPPKRREYIPKYGSAPYHVLITMRLNEIEDPSAMGIGQSELQRLMKPRTAGVLEGAVSRPTPAVGMALKTLREHECVYLQNSRYFLDECGRDLAERLIRASGDAAHIALLNAAVSTRTAAAKYNSGSLGTSTSRVSPAVATDSVSSSSSINSGGDGDPVQEDTYMVDVWEPGTFKTKLIIDNREVASRNDRKGLVNDLRNLGIDLDVQALSLGDCVWVAEHTRSGRRAVLDWIVERKTLGDLRSSIHDGRYHDQKRRLAKSTVPHVIYLVEYANNVANNEMFKDNRKKFMTAMSQTLVRQNFRLKLTRSQNETVQYIAKLTELLASKYSRESLRVVVPNVAAFAASMQRARTELHPAAVATDYSAFHEALAKSKMRTIGDTFRLTLRAIKGISAEKAMAIQKAFPTPAHLRRAYEAEPSEQKRKELVYRATQHCVKRQQLRLALSETVYDIWCPPISSSEA